MLSFSIIFKGGEQKIIYLMYAVQPYGNHRLYMKSGLFILLSELCAFLEHGEIEISNNQVENAIRPIIVGRKNWLFCDTQGGAIASTIIFTVLETTKANDLNPETYLNHILTVLPERFSQNSKAAIDDLLPWTEDIRRQLRV